MTDSHELRDGMVIPYSGGSMNLDTSTHREATDVELEQASRIVELEKALIDIVNILDDVI